MKKIYFALTLAIISSCSSSVNEDEKPIPIPENLPVYLPDIPCQEWNIQVNIAQALRLVNNKGEWSNFLDLDKISLSAVDKEGNLIYAPNGTPIQDVVNFAQIIKIYDDQNQLDHLFLKLGYIYEETKFNYAVSYFKLKLNESRTDDIIIYWDIRCANQLIYRIVYNGVEYLPNEFEPIDIIIE